jgi:hypothetical protein
VSAEADLRPFEEQSAMRGRAAAYPAVLVLSLAGLAHAPAEAQTPADGELGLAPGTRVRVTMASPAPSGGSGPRIVGRFEASDQSELILATGASEIALPRDAIVRLEQSVAPSRKTRGAWIGFGIGLAAMLGKAVAQGGCNDGCNSANVAEAAVVALSAAAVGAVASPGERWVDIPVRRGQGGATMPTSAGPRVRLAPQVGRRAGLTVVASF